MPKFFCDYCDVYLTHDSMSVRKAHNSGKNHLRNVVEYYQQIGHDRAQSVIDSITSSYAAEGQAGPMQFSAAQQMGGGPGMGPPPFGMPPPGGMPNFPGGPPPPGGFPPPNMGRGMNFPPPFPPSQSPGGGPPMPGGMPFLPPGGLPPDFKNFPPPNFPPPQGMGGPSPGPGGPSPGGQGMFQPPPGFPPGGPPGGFDHR